MTTQKTIPLTPLKEDARILVRGVNWLGDAVMSTSALIRLREALPKARITLLAPAKLADLWSGQSFLDEVIAFQKSDGVGGVSKKLRGRFDAALIFTNSFRSALEAWLAGIKLRAGYGAPGRSALLTHVIPRRLEEVPTRKKSISEIRRLIAETPPRGRETYPASAHQIHDYHEIISALIGPASVLPPPRIEVARAEKEAFRTDFLVAAKSRVIGLNPGAEYGPAKRWPTERFIETARLVEATSPATWLIFGGPADRAAAGQIEGGIKAAHPSARIINAAGRTSLRELRAGLALCDAVLTNDTGPMHLAAAVGTRVVVPFGSTSPELTGPGLPGSVGHALVLRQAACAPCFLRECPIDFRCMKSISVTEIASLLASAASPRSPEGRGLG